MKSNYFAILSGISVVTAADILCLAILYRDSDSSIGLLLWGAVAVAGLITAVLANSHRIALALTLSAFTALIFATSNLVWQIIGMPSDFPGVHGFFVVIGMTLPLAVILAGLGGVLGWLLRKPRT